MTFQDVDLRLVILVEGDNSVFYSNQEFAILDQDPKVVEQQLIKAHAKKSLLSKSNMGFLISTEKDVFNSKYIYAYGQKDGLQKHKHIFGQHIIQFEVKKE